jgi:hypothetical protein
MTVDVPHPQLMGYSFSHSYLETPQLTQDIYALAVTTYSMPEYAIQTAFGFSFMFI